MVLTMWASELPAASRTAGSGWPGVLGTHVARDELAGGGIEGDSAGGKDQPFGSHRPGLRADLPRVRRRRDLVALDDVMTLRWITCLNGAAVIWPCRAHHTYITRLSVSRVEQRRAGNPAAERRRLT